MEPDRTEKPPDHDEGVPRSKRIVLIGTCAGVVFAIMLVGIILAYRGYRARSDESKGWNREAMIASFNGIQLLGRFNLMTGKWEGDKFPYPRLVFNYVIENKTDTDCWFQSAAPEFVLMARVKAREPTEETLLKIASLYADLPNFVPAQGRAAVHIYFAEDFYSSQLSQALGLRESNPSSDAERAFLGPEKFVMNQWTNLNGFVAYDSRTRYQINFPRGW